MAIDRSTMRTWSGVNRWASTGARQISSAVSRTRRRGARFRKVKDPREDRSIWDSGWRLAVVVGSAVVLEVYLALYLELLFGMLGL